MRISGSRTKGAESYHPREAEAEVVAAVRREPPAAARRTAVVGGIFDPGAAANNTVGARLGATRVLTRGYRTSIRLFPRASRTRLPCIGRLCVVVLRVPIGTPFPDIAMHVIKPPGIRMLQSNRMQLAVRVVVILGMLVQTVRFIAEVPMRLGVGATRILPLGLGWQPVRFSCQPAEPFAIGAGVMPRNPDHQ